MIYDVPNDAPVKTIKRRKATIKRKPKASVAKTAISDLAWTGPGRQLADGVAIAPTFLPATEPQPTIQPPTVPRKRKWSDAHPELASSATPAKDIAEGLSEIRSRNIWASFLTYFQRLRAPQKRLRVCESVSLGEKRFLAIVRVDSESFLLGGSTGSVSMLAKLNDPATFSSVLQQKSAEGGSLQ